MLVWEMSEREERVGGEEMGLREMRERGRYVWGEEMSVRERSGEEGERRKG